MSEIEKMYENAGIEPDCTYLFLVDGNGENEAARTIATGSKADLKRLIVDCGVKGRVIKSTNTLKPFYPPFTAEKQIELIKWLARKDYGNYVDKLLISTNEGYTCFSVGISTDYGSECLYEENSSCSKLFEQTLSGLINNLWQDLTEEEKQQVKGILE